MVRPLGKQPPGLATSWKQTQMIEKRQILSEIKRLAAANGGRGPGKHLFERETGIKQSEWYPHTWLRWGDALSEAGCTRNQLQTKTPDNVLIEKYIALIRELQELPVAGEIKRKNRSDKSFPSHSLFNRFGGKKKLIEAVHAYCTQNSGYEDVTAICEERLQHSTQNAAVERTTSAKVVTGFVYLMKSGRHYKVGRTNSVGRRESELTIKIPVPPKTVHYIETDDPPGIEAYWHRRFVDKRGEGEWFSLSPERHRVVQALEAHRVRLPNKLRNKHLLRAEENGQPTQVSEKETAPSVTFPRL
jgi:hypothetical protein